MKSVGTIMVGTGCLFGLWALAALFGGLNRVNWQVTELMRQYLVCQWYDPADTYHGGFLYSHKRY